MKLTGRAFVDVAGVGRIRTKQGGATVDFGGFNCEGQAGDAGVNGFKESVAIPSIQMTIDDSADLDKLAINRLRNVEVTFEADSGQVHMLQQAWTQNPITLTSAGDLTWNMQGMRWDQVR